MSDFLLEWTPAEFFIGRVEAYAVYRSTDGATPVLLATLPVTYEWDGAKLSETLTYTDEATEGTAYDYYVVGLDIYQRALNSNTVRVADVEPFYRLLENGDIRALENDDLRVLEGAP